MTGTQKRSKAAMKTYRSPNRLAQLVERPGGVWRQQAVDGAIQGLDSVRGASMDALEGLITSMEAIVAAKTQSITEKMSEIRTVGSQIINLAGSYELAALTEASKRLCDLAAALAERNVVLDEALAVHMRALRLFSPHSPSIDEMTARVILQELYKVFKHFDIPVSDAEALG